MRPRLPIAIFALMGLLALAVLGASLPHPQGAPSHQTGLRTFLVNPPQVCAVANVTGVPAANSVVATTTAMAVPASASIYVAITTVAVTLTGPHVTDSNHDVYTAAASLNIANRQVQWWYSDGVSANAAFTTTTYANATSLVDFNVDAICVSSQALPNSLGAIGASAQGTSPQTSAITTTAANSMVLTAASANTPAGTLTWGGGAVQVVSAQSADLKGGSANQTAATVGVYSPSLSDSLASQIQIKSIEVLGGPPPPPPVLVSANWTVFAVELLAAFVVFGVGVIVVREATKGVVHRHADPPHAHDDRRHKTRSEARRFDRIVEGVTKANAAGRSHANPYAVARADLNRRRAGSHTVSGLLGLGTFLLVVLAIAEFYGYFASATLGGLTPSGVGALVVLAFVAAVGVYYLEERPSSSSPFGNRRGPKGRG